MPTPLPDLTKVFDRLFARRPGQPVVAGHALFQKTPEPAPGEPPAPPPPPPAGPQAVVRPPLADATGPLPATPRLTQWAATWAGRLTASAAVAFRRRRATHTVGIDVGGSALKVVRADHADGAPRVVAVSCQEFPARLEGKARQQAIQERLRELKHQGMLDGQIVVGCPDNLVGYELVGLPKMPAADLGRAVMWEAKERLSADPETYSIRHVIIGEAMAEGQPQYEILIMAASRNDVVATWKMFSEQGLYVTAVEPMMLAAAASCEQAGMWHSQGITALLEIGRRSSTLALVIGGGIRFVRSFPVAGDAITQSIVDYCQVDFDAAEQQKREIGLSQMALEEDRRVTGMENEPKVRVGHALGLYLERLAAEVEHSIRYFTVELGHAREQRLECVYLIGGGALLKNLGPFMASRLKAQVELANPFERCTMTAEARAALQVSGQGPRLAAALGLALRPVAR